MATGQEGPAGSVPVGFQATRRVPSGEMSTWHGGGRQVAHLQFELNLGFACLPDSTKQQVEGFAMYTTIRCWKYYCRLLQNIEKNSFQLRSMAHYDITVQLDICETL